MADTGYKLDSAKSICSRCGISFEDLKGYVSALREDDAGDLIRVDFCRHCWDCCPDDFFSFWQAKIRPGKKQDSVDAEAVMEFFHNLSERSDVLASELKYVLSLYLSRKKLLRLADIKQAKGGGESLVFLNPDTGQEMQIDDPHLTEKRVAEITDIISSIFPRLQGESD